MSQSLFLMQRRQFIKLSSAAFVGLAVSDLVAAPLSSPDQAGSIAVAFIDGDFDDAFRGAPPVIAAEKITTGEPRFLSHDAKVSILGLWRHEPSAPVSVSLKAYFPTQLQMAAKAPVFAWSFSTVTSARPSQGRFTIPVTDEGIQFEVERGLPATSSSSSNSGRRHASGPADLSLRSATELAAQSNSVTLSLGDDSGVAKLRPGRYIIAMLPAGAPKPDWSSYRFEPSATTADAHGPLRAATILGDDVVPFDYLLIRVDFA